MKVPLGIGILSLSAVLATEAGTPAHSAILENDRVWVEEVTFAPGDEEPQHTHSADIVVVVITGGSIESIAPDGKVTREGGKPGDVFFFPKGSTHRAKNTSGDRAVLRVIVLK
jgi:quercetin dioxygenase-like cupin family protein